MEFRIDKQRLLRVLRGDITRVELKTGHGDPHLLEEGYEGASSPPVSSDSDSDVVVYTHKDMVSSLTKQLEIQRQITDTCERDLRYRTEIIELLSARVVELESESTSWREQQKSFFALKEKMTYLEQLYGGDGARELEFAEPFVHVDPTVPEGQTLVEITYFESLKSQLETYRLEVESWKIRISTLETSLAEEKQICAASKAEYDTLSKEYRQSQTSSSQQVSILQTKFDELTDLEMKASAKNEELVNTLNAANEEIKKLTVDLSVAEEMRNAALATATTEANEYATLRGRLAELEKQVSIVEKEKVDLREQYESRTKELLECRNSLSSTQVKLQECEAALSSTRIELEHLQETHSQLVKSSADNLSSLEARLAAATEAAHAESLTLRQQLSTLQGEKSAMEFLISQLRGQLEQLELSGQTSKTRIRELEDSYSETSNLLTDLRSELSIKANEFEELKSTSLSKEEAARTRFAELEAQESTARVAAEDRIKELDTQIIVIKEACSHHTSELSQANAALEEMDALRDRLSEGTERIKELEESLSTSQERLNSLDGKLAEAQASIRDHEQRQHDDARAIEQLNKEHSNAIAEYEGRLSDLTTGATTNASRQAAMENEVSSLKSKVTALESDLSTARSLEEQARKEFEEESASLKDLYQKQLEDGESRVQTLTEQLDASEAARESLKGRLAELEQAINSTETQSDALQIHIKASLEEAEVKVKELQSQLEESKGAQTASEQTVVSLQGQLDEKSAACVSAEEKCDELQKLLDEKTISLEQLELKVINITELEEQVERLTAEKEAISTQLVEEKEDLQSKISALTVQCDQSKARQAELQSSLDKSTAESAQRQAKIETLEKEAKETGGRSSIDESSMQDLYAEHERQISQMEEDYDELRIERDAVIEERDKAIDERDLHQTRCKDLEKKIVELERGSSSSPSYVTSPTEMTDQASVADLQAKLRLAEERLRKTERALRKRTLSGDSEASDRSRDSIIIVESVDEHGRSEVREVRKIDSDAGSDTDTASDHTADNSTMAASISVASTSSSVAELEATKARAEQAEKEVRRLSLLLQGQQGEEQDKQSLKLSRNDSVRSNRSTRTSFSIANALSGASRMVGSIGHSEGTHLFPELSRKSSDHHHEEHDHHHHDISNPFLLFARDRKDSTRSRHSVSTSNSSSTSGTTNLASPTSLSASTSSNAAKDLTSPTRAALEREKKLKDKADKAERDRQEKAAKIEQEKVKKAEKAAKREKERLEREEKEKARKARLKADPNGLAALTAMRQGAGSYYENH
ncbi:hypothetical protein FRC17_009364 [Serendipita sp. 399]|nr:hypothetical protein FRC17_009364 [Serendipita sp. 399]